MPKQSLVPKDNIMSAEIISKPTRIWSGQRVKQRHQDISYDKDFSYRLAMDDEDQRAAWALRYHIYCEDSGFLPKELNSDGLEKDSYDHHSHQALLIHQHSRQVAGTVRLILPQPSDDAMALPALTHAAILREYCAPWRNSATVGEVSRFSIDPRFRLGVGQNKKASDVSTMLLGLVLAALDMARTHHIQHIVALVDPILVRLLHRIGVYWQPIGAPVYFHGFRQPSYIDCVKAMELLSHRYPAVIHRLQDLARIGPIYRA